MRGPSHAALGERIRRRSTGRLTLGSALLPVGSVLLAGCATGTARPTAPAIASATAMEPDRAAVKARPRLVRLEYSAPGACPKSDAFARYVEDRSPRLRVEPATSAGSARDGIRASVTLKEAKGRWLGEAVVDGSPARRIEGERCADVVSALALIVVLRLDAVADASESTQPSPATPTPLNAPVSSAGAANVDSERAATGDSPSIPEQPPRTETAAEAPSPEPRAAAARREPARETDDERRAAAAAPLPRKTLAADEPTRPAGSTGSSFQDRQLALTLHAGYATTPSDAIKAALGVELGAGPVQARWSLGLSFAFARGSHASATGDVTLDLLSAELALCPIERSVGVSSVWLRACALLRAGALAVSLSPEQPTLRGDAAWRPWLGMGPSLELGLPLSASWTLRARADVAAHTTRDAFVLERSAPDSNTLERITLYEPELFSLGLSIGTALRF
jgi:hypothetical protein